MQIVYTTNGIYFAGVVEYNGTIYETSGTGEYEECREKSLTGDSVRWMDSGV